jgi:hypothetical protein
MAKFLQITFSDGSVWEVPALPIAESRARYYAKRDYDGNGIPNFKSYSDELAYSLTDDTELLNFAGNLDWSDIFNLAVVVGQPKKVNYEEEWFTGNHKIVEH